MTLSSLIPHVYLCPRRQDGDLESEIIESLLLVCQPLSAAPHTAKCTYIPAIRITSPRSWPHGPGEYMQAIDLEPSHHPRRCFVSIDMDC